MCAKARCGGVGWSGWELGGAGCSWFRQWVWGRRAWCCVGLDGLPRRGVAPCPPCRHPLVEGALPTSPSPSPQMDCSEPLVSGSPSDVSVLPVWGPSLRRVGALPARQPSTGRLPSPQQSAVPHASCWQRQSRAVPSRLGGPRCHERWERTGCPGGC